MAIYLVQHGLSHPKDVDPQKGLSAEGVQDVERIAQVAKGYTVPVSSIVHSGKKRARQTAEIFDAQLQPKNGVCEVAGLSPMDDVRVFADTLDPESGIMYVGHLPFMERLTGLLTTGNPQTAVFAFQNAGIVCLNKPSASPLWQIRWTLMPKIG